VKVKVILEDRQGIPEALPEAITLHLELDVAIAILLAPTDLYLHVPSLQGEKGVSTLIYNAADLFSNERMYSYSLREVGTQPALCNYCAKEDW
jgi:hypothetical protein